MYRTLTLLLLLVIAATSNDATAQPLCIDGTHYALTDAETHRLLVALPTADGTAQDGHASALPDTYNIDGVDYEVCTTTLPLVQLQQPDDVDNLLFRRGHLTLIDPTATNPAQRLQDFNVEMRYRGGSALAYDKKNYAIKLLDPTTDTSLDASLLGMRNDNSWILDAMASDLARMRNRASTDFWLTFSQPPYYADQEPLMTNGTHGRFVEVFIGQRYWGLYCLTEKIDRKQLRVKKFKDGTPRGIIYKSFDYDNLREITDPNPSNDSFTWQGWECSYPDVRKGEPIDWTPLYQAIQFCTIPVPSFTLYDHLHEYFDLPLWRDYNLFCDLLHADDNACKNIIAYYRDSTQPADVTNPTGHITTSPPPGPLCVCPWDLDATWGRDFRRQPIDPRSNCNVANAVNFHLYNSQRDNGKAYETRWAELRQHHFTQQNIWSFFDNYFQLFTTSGAAEREAERWEGVNGLHLDFQAEAEYIHQWIAQRIDHLDADYNYVDVSVTTTTLHTAETTVYTLDGRQAHSHTAPGIYISAGHKIIVR